MADLNKVFLMGRLTFDPELRRTPTGTAVTELRMAASRNWLGRDGERREETLFIDVTVWDRQAENCCQYLRKGSGIHVEGFLKMDTWDDKTTGEKRSKVRVNADRVQFLDSRRGDSGGGGTSGPDEDYGSASPPARDASARRGGPPSGRPSGGGGYSEPRGPASTNTNTNTNGPARPSSPPPGPSDYHSPPESDNREEDDIPF
jgi:single-strand DNA-binding protein